MGRGRGKGKKLTVVSHEDAGSSEEEKVPVQKRRGRPQKPLKYEIDEHKIEKIEDNDTDKKGDISRNAAEENEKKRRRNSQAKEKQSLVKEEMNSSATKPSSAGDSSTSTATPNGFRHAGSRRKSTPRRAAEAVVELDIFPLAGISL